MVNTVKASETQENIVSSNSSEDALRVKNAVNKIKGKVGGFIDDMKGRREEFLENQRKIEEICIACERSGNEYLIPFGELIRESGNVNTRNPRIEIYSMPANLKTALIQAAGNGHTDITKLLLARPEILVNEKTSDGYTALISAAMSAHSEITKLLLSRPEIQVNELDPMKWSPFRFSTKFHHSEITKLLLADPRLDLGIEDQGKYALMDPIPPEIRALIEEAMRKQGIPF